MSVEGAAGSPDDGPVEIGDQREKHVTVLTRSGDRFEHGDVYFKHSAAAFVVSTESSFPEGSTERYAKESLLRVEVTQHHSACFITTATAERPETLDALRGFRDDAMARTPYGRALVGLYYAVSPPVARTLERHPAARTTLAVRWLVERCADLARRRDAAGSRVGRLSTSVLLTLAYAVGLVVGVVGHGCIRAREFLVSGDGSAAGRDGSAAGGTGPAAGAGHGASGEAADRRQDAERG